MPPRGFAVTAPSRRSRALNRTSAWATLPQNWHAEVTAQLEPGESLLAWFEPDLDERLHYAQGLVVLTDRRVLGVGPAGSPWQAWRLEPEVDFRVSEHGGTGILELVGPASRLAHYCYTLGRASG